MLNRPYDIYGLTGKYEGYDPKGLLACHVVKNRNGETGMIPFDADMRHFTIWERPETINIVSNKPKRHRVKATVELTDEAESDDDIW